ALSVGLIGVNVQLGTATTYVKFGGSGGLLITPAGLAAQFDGSLDASHLPISIVAQQVTLALNTTGAAASKTFTAGGQTFVLSLPAGNFVKVAARGVSITVAGKGLSGDFTFEQVTESAPQTGKVIR